MGLYKNTNGVLAPIAGRGKAEYGASTIRTGTLTYTVPGATAWNALGQVIESITFDTPMPDADYEVSLMFQSPGSFSHQVYNVCNKTANGFSIIINNLYIGQATQTLNYTAFKLYTDNEYNDVLQLSRPDLWPLDTEIAFENGLYGMHKAGNITLSANTQYNLIVVPKSAGLTTTANFIDRGGWWSASNNYYKYFIDVNWGNNQKTCYWLDFRSTADTPCIKLAFQNGTAGTYAYDTWVTYTKS